MKVTISEKEFTITKKLLFLATTQLLLYLVEESGSDITSSFQNKMFPLAQDVN